MCPYVFVTPGAHLLRSGSGRMSGLYVTLGSRVKRTPRQTLVVLAVDLTALGAGLALAFIL